MKEKRLTIFAPYFPPRPRVGALRPYKFASYLSRRDWEVSVVTINDSKHVLTDKEKAQLKGVSIFELFPQMDRTVGEKNHEDKKRTGALKKEENRFANWLDRQFPLDTWLPFLWFSRHKVVEYLNEIKPSILLSTADPWSGAFVAAKIARTINVPWICDLRDPWTLCETRFPKKGLAARQFERRAERKILNQATVATFTAKETERKYLQKYSFLEGKTKTILNSFESFEEFPQRLKSNPNNGRFIILFLGRFRSLSTAESIIKVCAELKRVNPDIYKKVEIHSYGELEEEDSARAQKYGVLNRFISRERVPHEEIQSEIQQADLLLLSTKPERNDIIPAKIFDYLPMGKPILSLVQNPEVEEILSSTNTGKQFLIGSEAPAAHFIIDVYNRTHNFDPNFEVINSYSTDFRAKELDDLLTKVIENGQ